MRSRRWLALGLLAGILAATFSAAFGLLTATGTGPGGGAAQMVDDGNAPTVDVTGRTAQLSWDPSSLSAGSEVAGYLIRRYDSSGTLLQTIMSGSCASLVAANTCVETAVPPGSWQYAVVPAQANWRGAQSARIPATVGAPALALAPAQTQTPSTVSGTIADFLDAETLRFRLDGTSGPLLAGTVGGAPAPAAVPSGGAAMVTVDLPVTLSEGPHDIYVVASPSGESASFTVTVDNTPPPDPTITSGPALQVQSSSAALTFTNPEPGVLFECRLDGGSYSACASPATYTGLSDGAHTFDVRALDPAGLFSGSDSHTWTVDTVAPAAAVTFAANGGIYSAATYAAGCGTPAADLCGTSSDTGTGVAQVDVSLRNAASGLYWNGTSFGSATEVFQSATGTTSWSRAFLGANFPAEGSFTLKARATDGAGNIGASSTTFVYDAIGPVSTVSSPLNGGSYNNATYTSGCATPATADICGTAADGGSGVSTVRVSIQRGTGNYWNGTGFTSATEVLLTPTGTTSWSYNLAAASFPANGAYTVRVRSTDVLGNTGSVAASTFTIDRTLPTGTDIQTVNLGLILGRAELGDTITYTYSEAMNPLSILAGWSGAVRNVVVRIDNAAVAGNDALRVWDSTNSTQLPLGSVDLRRTDHVTGNVTFGATGVPSTMVRVGSLVTVTLGTPSNTALITTAGGNGAMRWTPAAAATDLAGNAASTATVTEQGANDRDF